MRKGEAWRKATEVEMMQWQRGSRDGARGAITVGRCSTVVVKECQVRSSSSSSILISPFVCVFRRLLLLLFSSSKRN